MKVTFNDFSLDRRDKGVLKFYDGTSVVSTLLGSYHGTRYPEVIYSTGESLYVKFNTYFPMTGKGFSIRFTAVKEGI